MKRRKKGVKYVREGELLAWYLPDSLASLAWVSSVSVNPPNTLSALLLRWMGGLVSWAHSTAILQRRLCRMELRRARTGSTN